MRVTCLTPMDLPDWNRLAACPEAMLFYPSVPRFNYASGPTGFKATLYCRIPTNPALRRHGVRSHLRRLYLGCPVLTSGRR